MTKIGHDEKDSRFNLFLDNIFCNVTYKILGDRICRRHLCIIYVLFACVFPVTFIPLLCLCYRMRRRKLGELVISKAHEHEKNGVPDKPRLPSTTFGFRAHLHLLAPGAQVTYTWRLLQHTTPDKNICIAREIFLSPDKGWHHRFRGANRKTR